MKQIPLQLLDAQALDFRLSRIYSLMAQAGAASLVVSANALVERILDTQREDAQKAQAPEGDKA